ncbi:VOC family protein [Phaeobacter gallaeciensis]|uniref:VOC family protein n=2 Tax=Roseobacteraceae TaxID=2854170 RepID=A0A366X282_9RHOB|nr:MULTISPECIES: VOC family protein [Roseobacteraceae]MBT3139450.1 VOC family protein [Falsiruegeria litorea]MBT8166994.1 VOC family protein [Falsiruegeria litorea]RBW57344.1 VOC family protein [Phaeobacter gallaeciensis]
MQLDHLAVAGETLSEAVAHVEQALGVATQPGGQHPRYGTHNRLIGLMDGLYLEAIAIEPGVVPENQPRWFDLDNFKGPARLTNWILRSPSLEQEAETLSPHARQLVAMQRGDLRWLMTVPVDGLLPYENLYPAVLEWQGRLPVESLAPTGCRLLRLTIRHPDGDALGADVAPILKDQKVAFEAGPHGMSAEFETPHGRRVLE